MNYRIYYTSVAASRFEVDRLSELAAKAAQKNSTLNITGALMFNGVNFAQVLEGDKDAVMTLYKQIEADERHSLVQLLGSKVALTRFFPDWSMKLLLGSDFSKLEVAMLND